MWILMTFEKLFCTRCGAMQNCIVLHSMAFCEACLDTMLHDYETKETMEKIMIQCGVHNFEN